MQFGFRLIWITASGGLVSKSDVLIDSLVFNIFSQLYGDNIVVTEQCHNVPSSHRFLIIPGKHGLRWIVPAEPALGWPVLQQWRPYDVRSILKWNLLGVAYRWGRLGSLPAIYKVGIEGVLSLLKIFPESENAGRIIPVIYVGTSGPARKAVVALVGQEDTRPYAIVKLPLGEMASKAILHEADMLERLAVFREGIAPKLFFVDELGGISIQQMVTGKLSGRKLTRQHIDLLCLLRSGKITTIALFCESLLERIREIHLPDAPVREHITQLVEVLADSTPLPAVWVHGDFAPWNLKLTEQGGGAIDWEEAQENALPLIDLLYFFAIQGYLFGGKHDFINNFFNHHLVQRYLEVFELTPHVAGKIALLGLIGFWLQRVQRGEMRHARFLFLAIAAMREKLS